MRHDPDQVPRHDETAELEQALIADFLEQRGHTPHSVQALPDAERHALLRDAALHASMRLSEMESRAQYVHDIRRK